MGRIQVVLPDDVEKRLRDEAKKKGDISAIVTEALKEHFQKLSC